jgi:RND family efflux transporter MFP subunit
MPNIRRFPFEPLLLCLVLTLSLFAAGCSGEAAPGEETTDEGSETAAAAETDGEAGEGNGEGTEEKAEAESEEDSDKKKKPRKERSTSVSASPVVRGDLVLPIIGEGSIQARNSTEIKFEVDGRLEELWVQEGQRVRRGQKLARLDDREYKLALEEARSRYLQALGQLAVEEEGYQEQEAERSLEQEAAELSKLESEGVISRRERLDRELELGMDAVREGAYRRELLEVRSGLAAARADAERAAISLERTLLRAPFGGVVSGLDCARGERIQIGETLARLIDDVNVEAEIGVLESDLGALRKDSPVLLTIPALGETLEVAVDVISPDIDFESRTCPVLMRLQSKDGRYKPGMFVRAAIAGNVLEDRLLVPVEAILTRDGRPVVFRIEDGRAKWVYVQLGARNDHLVEITRIDQGGPLDPGTMVVVANHLTLTHDAKVKIKKKVGINDPWYVEPEQEDPSD